MAAVASAPASAARDAEPASPTFTPLATLGPVGMPLDAVSSNGTGSSSRRVAALVAAKGFKMRDDVSDEFNSGTMEYFSVYSVEH